MTAYLRPGAYYERVDRAGRGAVSLRTDIACFIGIAETGPLDTPVPVESVRHFESHFGGYTGAGYLAYSVKAFFENGGARAWIIRVASRRDGLGAAAASAPLGAGWTVSASSPGIWGDALEIRLSREAGVETAAHPGPSSPIDLVVDSVSGFARLDHVQVSQPGVPDRFAVLSGIDPSGRILRLAPQDPDFPYRGQSLALVPDRPARVSRITYALDIYRDRRFRTRASGLSLIRENPDYAGTRLALPDYEEAIRLNLPVSVPPLVTVQDTTVPGNVPLPLAPTAGRLALAGGRNGLAALDVADFAGDAFDLGNEAAEAFGNRRGIRALEFVDEVSIVAVPDILIRPDPDPVRTPEPLPPSNPCIVCPPPPEPRRMPAAPTFGDTPPTFTEAQIFRVQSALVAHCEERGDRFAVLDPPFEASRENSESLRDILSWRNRFNTGHAALYFPWMRVYEPRGTDVLREIPPSGHVIGKYAFHDLRTGVHRAPANTRLSWAQGLTTATAFAADEILNEQSVNVIRSEPGRGFRIMGARTLSTEPAARYVNVRRLILMIRRAVDMLTQWVVFEPNSAATRTKLTSVLQNFLTGLFARGAFAGATAEQSFFVQCDEQNNTPADRDAGRLLAEIGIAPAVPLEFIVVRVGRQGNELTVDETASVARARL